MQKITASYTDFYQLTMAQVYFLNQNHEDQSVFDYFFRKLPFHSGYAIFSGLEVLIDILEDFKFTPEELQFLEKQGFHKDFINYLSDFQFNGEIKSVQEGDLIFPTRPVLQVKATIIEAQIIETLVLNILNFQTLIATKASRIRLAAPHDTLIDFGMRRAQATGAYYASRAAYIGGFDATSNVKAATDFGIPVSGTMAHAFIQSYENELDAFRDFAEVHPDNCVLLIDTYDTLRSGLPNAIKIAKELEAKGHKLKAIRLDSGDLSYLSKRCRKMLDQEGLSYVKIAASNQLDEHVIKSLKDQNASIDVYGVGTNLVIGNPDAALDGVYKLAFADGKPRIKLSENVAKSTLPSEKQVYRIRNQKNEMLGADIITQVDETNIEKMHHPFDLTKSTTYHSHILEPLLKTVMKDGKRYEKKKSLAKIKAYAAERLNELPEEYKRFSNPHIYKIGVSTELLETREKLRETLKK
ncbi:nicotinate phosphoribosyltransferase [Psychroflexus halocasei]|uniref:Nicotinate phosphoribosyltransferase n=1 Tax=Psychroflexus halocasei TaxID=908615 RepID=A0A1H4BIJ4_9FLAO|nr:nicotinate phosphoribosyltransferase [Psychroflexus halocasei]SEA47950.1 nicotinate phosphoribosyltransferase [Psychroflexus halocasei]